MTRSYEDATRTRYGELAASYVELFADTRRAHPLDRAAYDAFTVQLVPGQVADLGCGPGHWTRHLDDLGLDVFGLDLSPVFVARARTRYPGIRFVEGSVADLDLADGSLGGAVAWFSLIHVPPAELPGVLAEIARVLAPGAPLLVGFAATDAQSVAPEPYDHAVAAAYRWPADALSTALRDADLVETARLHREPAPDERFAAGCLIATKRVRTAPLPYAG